MAYRDLNKARATRRLLHQKHKVNVNRKTRRNNFAIFLEMLRAYSGDPPSCQCECGCRQNVVQLLTLDHVQNDGAAHRKKVGRGWTGTNFFRFLKNKGWPKDPPLRILCFNCNCGRQRNGGVCPLTGQIVPPDGVKYPSSSLLSENISAVAEMTAQPLFDNLDD